MTKILIVDDSSMNLKVAQHYIEINMENVEVKTILDSEEAMTLLLAEFFPIIILDIVMPKVNGIELLKWIKEKKTFEKTKVIMYSSLEDGSALASAFSLGAYDYIKKPLEEYEFLSRIRHAIDEYNHSCIIDQNIEDMKSKNEELHNLNLLLRKTQADLIQTERLVGIGFLAAGVAHELNNPLSYIQSNLTLLEKSSLGLLDLYKNVKALVPHKFVDQLQDFEKRANYNFIQEELMEIHEDIQNGVHRMTRIINALRNFSRVDSDKDIEIVNLVEVFQNIKILTANRSEKKFEFVVNSEEEALVYGNKGDINLSFMNIIINSIEAINASEKNKNHYIRITLMVSNDHLEIYIEDSGIGMPEEVLHYAINPFYTTKEVGDGAGLGLSTAYNCFVHVLKGQMQMESLEGEGTYIHVSLPLFSKDTEKNI